MKIKVLDKGFIEVVDSLGNDLTVVNSARVSFGKRKEKWDKSDSMLKYFLGSALEGLTELPEGWTGPDDAVEERDRLQTYSTGAKSGETEAPTSYKLNRATWYAPVLRSDIIARMVLQTWLFNSSLRNDLMILDPWDWDSMPESLDITTEDILSIGTKGTFSDLAY